MGEQNFSAGERLRYPDFICIGAQKAGTTWLHQKLGQHPDVWLPPLKEIHYFDALYLEKGSKNLERTMRANAALRVIRRSIESESPVAQKLQRIQLLSLIGRQLLTDNWYGSIFAAAGDGRVCGEITPSYALLPDEGIAHVTKLAPKLKVIFVLRDPIDRAWSELRMRQKKTGDSDIKEIQRIVRGKAFYARADYLGTIDRFARHISPEHFLILKFDDISDQPDQVMRALCDFLGLQYDRGHFSALTKVVHKGLQESMNPGIYDLLRERLEPVYRSLLSQDDAIYRRWHQRHFG